MNNLKIVRAALVSAFGRMGVDEEMAAVATCTGAEDTGGWAPSAPVIVKLEYGIPMWLPDMASHVRAWDRFENLLAARGLYWSPINAAVGAVYKVD